MSLLLSCEACTTPVARLDTLRYPVGPSATYCVDCSAGVRIAATLALA